MSEPTPTTQTTNEPATYQPISGWAIAGFLVGTLFALLVAASSIIGLYQRAPVFFPRGMVLAVALAGVALGIVGLRHVQNSEGTRAGAKLARFGLWLSLVSGLVYFSYYFVTGLAVQNQANAFLIEKGEDAGFFPYLGESADNPAQLNAAFLLSQAPNSRSARPEDEFKMRQFYDKPGQESLGLLTQFRESSLARVFFKHLGKEAKITPLSVQEWYYDKNSYKVKRGYRVKTKEIEYDFVLSAFSVEAEAAGQGRKWFVNLEEFKLLAATLTPLGEGVKTLRRSARDWLDSRLRDVGKGKPLPEINERDRTAWQFMPLEDMKPKENRAMLHQILAAEGKDRIVELKIFTMADHYGKWEQIDGKIRHHFLFRFIVPRSAGRPNSYQVDAIAEVESLQAINPLEPPANPDWNLVGITFTTVYKIPEQKGDGPGGGMPPPPGMK